MNSTNYNFFVIFINPIQYGLIRKMLKNKHVHDYLSKLEYLQTILKDVNNTGPEALPVSVF